MSRPRASTHGAAPPKYQEPPCRPAQIEAEGAEIAHAYLRALQERPSRLRCVLVAL